MTEAQENEIVIRDYSELPRDGKLNTAYTEFIITSKDARPVQTNGHDSFPTAFLSTSSSLLKTVRDVFLPVGFPHTVGPGYWEYQFYDSLQGLCSYLRGVVSSAHVLHATGVGNTEATAWSAALTWALKDGMGMMGGLVFSSIAAPLFDSHVKEFRFFADLINNVALTLDMLSPVLPSEWFLWVAAASTLCKTMCGMSAGATKGSITQHFALAGNLADLHAKEGTQETLVSLIGMTFGVGLARYFQRLEQESEEGTDTTYAGWRIQWMVFGLLTALHVWSNFQAVQILRLRTLNWQRAVTVLQPLVTALHKDKECNQTLDEFPQPAKVQESLAASTWNMVLPRRWKSIRLGVPLAQLLNESVDENITARDILLGSEGGAYVISVSRRNQILVSLLVDADLSTELQAFLHAQLIRRNLRESSSSSREQLVRSTRALVNRCYQTSSPLTALREKGWEVDSRLYLGFSEQRCSWTVGKKID